MQLPVKHQLKFPFLQVNCLANAHCSSLLYTTHIFNSDTNCAPGRPRNIQFSNVATKSFDVSFDPPTTANGRIVQYSITAVSQDGRLPYSRTIQTGPAARLGTFGNLEEAVIYEVTISAENQFTSGDSNSDEVTTKRDGKTDLKHCFG